MSRSSRRVRSLTACLTLLVAGCAASPTESASPAKQPAEIRTLSEWNQCAMEVVDNLENYCEDCSSAAGELATIKKVCGDKPGERLDEHQRQLLADVCRQQPFDDLALVYRREFETYGIGSPIWKMAATECNRIYTANAENRKPEDERFARDRFEADETRTDDKAAARSKPMNIERAYQASSDYVGIVIRTNEARRLKCALLNGGVITFVSKMVS